METSIARLSSGKRITRAHDDAAGSAIAGRMDSQIRGLTMNVRNAKDGQSLVDTQEGALQEVSAMLQRMRELAVQAGNGAASATDRGYLDLEVKQLVAEIDAMELNTKFNNTVILDGTQFSFYSDIDVAGTAIQTIAVDITVTNIGTGVSIKDVSIAAIANVDNAIAAIDTGIASIAAMRASLGAVSNRFDHVIDNLSNVIANTEGAKSRIEDADFAIETTQLTRNTVLQQAATSMVAQANASKNSILALIQG
jgi:flagellin